MVKPLSRRRQSSKSTVLNFSALPVSHRYVGRGVSRSTRYSSWEVYGKVQEALAKDEAFAKLWAHTTTFAELTGRNIEVSIDL